MTENYEFKERPPGPVMTKRGKPWLKPLIAFVVVLAVAGGSFFGGMKYQSSKKSNTSAAPSIAGANQAYAGQPGASGGPNGTMGAPGTMGKVTAITSSSISVTDTMTNQVTTFSITSSTSVQNNESTASANDIKVGDSVLVIASTSDSSVAAQIMLNPSTNAPGGTMPPPGSSSGAAGSGQSG